MWAAGFWLIIDASTNSCHPRLFLFYFFQLEINVTRTHVTMVGNVKQKVWTLFVHAQEGGLVTHAKVRLLPGSRLPFDLM